MVRRRNASPASRGSAKVISIEETLASMTEELQWLQLLPKLVASHGFDAVDAAMAKLLSAAQRKACWKKVNERATRLIWLDLTDRSDLTISFELAIIITTHGLDEVERKEFNDNTHESSKLVMEFLDAHSTTGTAVVAGVDLARKLKTLQREMPSVHHHLNGREPLDMAHGGVQRFAALIGRDVMPSTADDVVQLEREMRGANHTGSTAASQVVQVPPPIERLEEAIVKLGVARSSLITPPAARKYVTAGLYCYCAMLVLLCGRMCLQWVVSERIE